ncbi:MAG TPA: hypothetical protein VGQ39_06895 [Pyrinomonadaceae bacterium]|jgi:hypothetical protein|nr:hypothetical protein [Pyrinomonadaceae bacterium]
MTHLFVARQDPKGLACPDTRERVEIRRGKSEVRNNDLALQHEAPAFPILLTKVLYSGTHAGDYLTLNDIADVKVELERLGSFVCSQQCNQEYID